MENIIRIPTAKQAREIISQKANEKCNRVWNDILHDVENILMAAISECKTYAAVPDSALRGAPKHTVYLKLRPYLEGMGYRVDEESFGIWISWSESEDNDESV